MLKFNYVLKDRLNYRPAIFKIAGFSKLKITYSVNNSRPPLGLRLRRLAASPPLAVQRRLNHAPIKFMAV